MDGSKVPSEARRREAAERRGGWGLGRSAVAPPQYGGVSKNQRWNCTFLFGFSNVWRVTPVAKQPAVCNSGAKFFSNPWRGGIHPCPPPSGYAPVKQRIKSPNVEVVNRLSKADGSRKCSINPCSSISLCETTTTSPMRLQEHEVLHGYHSPWRVNHHGVEEGQTKAEGRIVAAGGRVVLGKVREQSNVVVGSAVAVRVRDATSVYLPKINTAELYSP